jgi:hypothetical protein
MRNDILLRLGEVQQWIAEQRSKAFMCKELQCKPITLDNFLKRQGIEYKGNKGAVGYKKIANRLSVLEYLKTENPKAPKIRKKLIEDGVKEARCENCKMTHWMDAPIALELHHVDGNHYNNVLENLQILCPNCHAQTENYGSSKLRMVFEERKTLKSICKCGCRKYHRSKQCAQCGIKQRKKKNNICKCGKIIQQKSKMCEACNSINNRKVDRPSLDVLKAELESSNYSALGRKYGVSDNAIRKWLKNS